MELAKEFDNTITEDPNNIPHALIFDYFIKFINSKNINYVIIRGFQKLPDLPDTDLDIMIDNNQFQQVVNMLKHSKYFEHRAPKNMNISNTVCTYHPFFTKGPKDPKIPNGCFRLDMHNAFCFFYKKNVVVPKVIEKEIYDTKIRYKQLYNVPNHQWEFILLLYRITYDLGGRIREKHINRLKFLQEQLILNYGVINRCLDKIKVHDTYAYDLFSNFIQKNLPIEDPSEHHAFIFWTAKMVNDFKNMIKDTHLTLIKNVDINIPDKAERYSKINSIYEIEIPKNHPKVLLNDPIRIYIIKDQRPVYDVRVTSGLKMTKVVNTNIFELKRRLRAKCTPIDVHSSDEVNEANKIFQSFGFPEYLNKHIHIPIRFVRGVVWKTQPPNRTYELRKIGNTPHYRYLMDINKQEYVRYVQNIDRLHSNISNFKQLIQNFDPIRCFANDKPTSLILDNGFCLIYNGLHRVSLLKYFGYNLLSVNVMPPQEADKSVYKQIKYDSIE